MIQLNMRILLSIILCTFFTAFAAPIVERNPAGSESSVIDKIFTIDGSGSVGSKSYKAMVEQALPSVSATYEHIRSNFEYVVDKTRNADKPFKVELEFQEGKRIYKVYHSTSAFRDLEATKKLIIFLQGLRHADIAASVFEMYFNAYNGDPISLKAFLKIKNGSNSETNLELETKLNEEIKTLKSWRKVERDKRLRAMEDLDSAADEKQFITLVAKGDRKGAAKLLKAYIPWEQMPPFEKKYWETYLEVMANPVPLEERVFIYRGFKHDIRSAFTRGDDLSKEEAISQSKAFFMSRVLTKNNGPWNRRLRTLESMYEKKIAAPFQERERTSTHRISTMFSNHAGSSAGSPFLSFSPDIAAANDFGVKRLAGFLIDPRLLQFNYGNPRKREVEFLVNLTTFPEDLVAIFDQKIHGIDTVYYDLEFRQNFFEEKLKEKIRKKYGVANAENIVEKIRMNSYSFFADKFFNQPVVFGANPGPSNKRFYKSLGKEAIKPVLGPSGELKNRDIIQLFFSESVLQRVLFCRDIFRD